MRSQLALALPPDLPPNPRRRSTLTLDAGPPSDGQVGSGMRVPTLSHRRRMRAHLKQLVLKVSLTYLRTYLLTHRRRLRAHLKQLVLKVSLTYLRTYLLTHRRRLRAHLKQLVLKVSLRE